jgi:hypothetical protein
LVIAEGGSIPCTGMPDGMRTYPFIVQGAAALPGLRDVSLDQSVDAESSKRLMIIGCQLERSA